MGIYHTILQYRDVDNFDVLLGFLLVYTCILNLVDNVQPLYRSSKNSMLIIKPWLYEGQHEFGIVQS